jgi:hypothetical protein
VDPTDLIPPVTGGVQPVADAAAVALVPDDPATVQLPSFDPVSPIGIVPPGAGASEASGGYVAPSVDDSWLPHLSVPFSLAGDEARLITTISFVVGTLALSARAARGAGEIAAPAQVIFTNARLIPCYAGDAVHRATATAVKPVRHASDRIGKSVDAVQSASRALAEPVRHGFASVTRGEERLIRRTQVDGASDTRLLMQIGALLGAVYIVFLTAWLWTTRTRLERRH